jgi:hypothetical protein
MTPETPDDSQLARLIAQAHDRFPSPDPRRLAAIEAQLVAPMRARRRSSATWWWLAVALATGAAAAWWTVNYPLEKQEQPPVPAIAPPQGSPPATERTPPRPAESGGPEAGTGSAQKSGPVIFRSER